MNLPSLNLRLKQKTFQQLHTAFINGRMTTLSYEHSGHKLGRGSHGLCLFRVGWFLWMAMASFTFLLKSLSSLASTFTSAKVYLWPVLEVRSVMAALGCLMSVCSLNLHPQCPSCFTNVLLPTPTILHTVHHHTLFLCALFLRFTNSASEIG